MRAANAAAGKAARPFSSGELLESAVAANVRLNVGKLKTSGPVISKMVEEGTVKVVRAIYRLGTRQVNFLS